MKENLIASGVKMLLTKFVGENAAEFIGEVATAKICDIFGEKKQDTPNGQFLMLMDDSLRQFCDYLNEIGRKYEYDPNAYKNIKIDTLKSFTNESMLKSMLKDMLGDESYELLNSQDINKWINIVEERFSQDRYQVFHRHILFLIRTSEQNQLSVDSVLKVVQVLNTIDGEETIEDVLCDWFDEQCSKMDNAVNKDILEVGYILTDYLEKRKKYDKSVQIANQILEVYAKKANENIHDKEDIQKIIGCAYSLAIANVKPEDKKLRLLENSEFFFKKAYELCKAYENKKENQYEDIKFLWGLYHTDYGAMRVNWGDYYKRKGDISAANKFYQEAIAAHEKSLRCRISLKEASNDSKLYNKNQIESMIARAQSSIGGVYYRLGKYEESIEQQKEALKVFENQGDIIREYRTKELIVGNYIALWEDNKVTVKRENFDICMDYMKTAEVYYKTTKNKSLDGVVKKIEKLENIEAICDIE